MSNLFADRVAEQKRQAAADQAAAQAEAAARQAAAIANEQRQSERTATERTAAAALDEAAAPTKRAPTTSTDTFTKRCVSAGGSPHKECDAIGKARPRATRRFYASDAESQTVPHSSVASSIPRLSVERRRRLQSSQPNPLEKTRAQSHQGRRSPHPRRRSRQSQARRRMKRRAKLRPIPRRRIPARPQWRRTWGHTRAQLQ